MNKRPIDKTKKSNIKCEHCKYYYGELTSFYHKNEHRYYYDVPTCKITKEPKRYWNRCKQFEWAESED